MLAAPQKRSITFGIGKSRSCTTNFSCSCIKDLQFSYEDQELLYLDVVSRLRVDVGAD